MTFFSLWLGAAKAVVIQFLKENELSEEVRNVCFMLWESRMEKSILMAGLRISPIQKLLWILRMNFKGADLSGQPKSEDAAGAAVC